MVTRARPDAPSHLRPAAAAPPVTASGRGLLGSVPQECQRALARGEAGRRRQTWRLEWRSLPLQLPLSPHPCSPPPLHSAPPRLLVPFCLHKQPLGPNMRSRTQLGHPSADVLTHQRQDACFNLSSYAAPRVSRHFSCLRRWPR